MASRLTALGLLLVLAGCGGEGSLGGSLSDVYDLSFETVRARLFPSDLAIEFVNAKEEVVVRLTVKRALKEPHASETVDLASEGDVTGTSGGVGIPRIARGTLTLTAWMPNAGAQVIGRFEAVFASGSAEYDLHGDFSTTLEIVPPK